MHGVHPCFSEHYIFLSSIINFDDYVSGDGPYTGSTMPSTDAMKIALHVLLATSENRKPSGCGPGCHTAIMPQLNHLSIEEVACEVVTQAVSGRVKLRAKERHRILH